MLRKNKIQMGGMNNLIAFKPAESYLNISANRYQPSRTLSQFDEMDHDKTISMISTILVADAQVC